MELVLACVIGMLIVGIPMGVLSVNRDLDIEYWKDKYWEKIFEAEQSPVEDYWKKAKSGAPIEFYKGCRYVPERKCKVSWKHIGGDVVAGYCECGVELDRCHDYEPAHLPNYCPVCGTKVIGSSRCEYGSSKVVG